MSGNKFLLGKRALLGYNPLGDQILFIITVFALTV
nr:MAG TPA: hypothetical protein [Caudoviricetes sp.]DAS26359.1 MAG TPA: hypothetical protein [Caudoviricetes sp.]